MVMNEVRIIHDVQDIADYSKNDDIINDVLKIDTPAGVIRGKTVWDNSGLKTKNLFSLFLFSLIPQVIIKGKISVENNGIYYTATKGIKMLLSNIAESLKFALSNSD